MPLIHNEDRDFSPPVHANWLKQIGYTYAKAGHHDNLEYNQEDVDRNFQLFIKYQTFINGDNAPEGVDAAPPVPVQAAADPNEGASTEVPADTPPVVQMV